SCFLAEVLSCVQEGSAHLLDRALPHGECLLRVLIVPAEVQVLRRVSDVGEGMYSRADLLASGAAYPTSDEFARQPQHEASDRSPQHAAGGRSGAGRKLRDHVAARGCSALQQGHRRTDTETHLEG